MTEFENGAALRQIEEQNAQLLALFLASQRLASTLDPGEVQATIFDILVEFTGVAAASLWLRDSLRDGVCLAAARGLEKCSVLRIPLGEGIIGNVMATGDELLDGVEQTDPATGLPTLAAIPLLLHGNPIGAVAIHRLLPQKPALDDTARALLRLIAGQAAAALTSARLYGESQSVVRGFGAISEQIAHHLDDLETVMTTTVSAVAGLLRADVCQLFLVDDDSGDLVLRATAGDNEAPVGGRLRPGEGVAGRTLQEARTTRLAKDQRHTQRTRLNHVEGGPLGTRLGSVLAVPLRVGDDLFGVLSVGRSVGALDWNQYDEGVLDTAANQLAVGINNARLYARVEDEYYRTSTLFMAANRLHETLDLNEILRSARDILENLIGAQVYAIVLLDEQTDELRVAVSDGIPTAQAAAFRARRDEGLFARVIESGDLFIGHADKLPRERIFGLPVLACLPLQVEGVPVGAIVINRLLPQKAGLLATDHQLFAMLAQHAATAILAARLYARAEQKLVTLYDLSRLISASITSEDVLDLSMSLVKQVMEVEVAALYTFDSATNLLELTHAAGLPELIRGSRILLGQEPAGVAVATGQLLETANADQDEQFHTPGGWFRGNALAMPLKIENAVVGALVISEKSGGPFTDSDRRLASTLASQIALILHHTSLYEHARHLAILLDREREALRGANHELALVNSQLDALVEHLDEGVVLVDAGARAIRLNTTSRALLGIDGEAVDLLDPASLHVVDDDGDPVRHDAWPLTRALGGESVRGFDCRVKARDGQMRAIEVSAEPIYHLSGSVALAVAVFRDVTASRALDRAKDEFIATASHELKSPLTALKGFAQLLLRQAEREGMEAEGLRRLRRVDEQTDRLIRLVDRLLDVSRIDLGRIHLDAERIDLGQLVERLAVEQRVVCDGRPITVRRPAEPIAGWWDRARIEQVLLNLIGNAHKYTPPDREIIVGLKTDGDWVRVSVRDHGEGIPQGQIEHIFDRYFQAASGEHRSTGLGLGLYVSRRIVEAHGGRIWVESASGEGSTFYFQLPRWIATAESSD